MYLAIYTKINSNWAIVLNVSDKIIKLIEENIGENLYYLGWSNFLNMTSKAWTTKKKKPDKPNFIKIKLFLQNDLCNSHFHTHHGFSYSFSNEENALVFQPAQMSNPLGSCIFSLYFNKLTFWFIYQCPESSFT